MEKILPISLKLNFTPNTLDCFGLRMQPYSRSVLLGSEVIPISKSVLARLSQFLSQFLGFDIQSKIKKDIFYSKLGSMFLFSTCQKHFV